MYQNNHIQSGDNFGSVVCARPLRHMTKGVICEWCGVKYLPKNPAKNVVRLKWMKHLKMSENRGSITKLRGRARLYQQYHISHNGEITYNRDR